MNKEEHLRALLKAAQHKLPGIEFFIELDDYSKQYRTRLRYADISLGYQFLLQPELPEALFVDTAQNHIRNFIDSVEQKLKTKPVNYGEMYGSSPWSLTVTDELELAEEIQQIRERFYKKKQDYIPASEPYVEKIDISVYKEIEDYGTF